MSGGVGLRTPKKKIVPKMKKRRRELHPGDLEERGEVVGDVCRVPGRAVGPIIAGHSRVPGTLIPPSNTLALH